MDGISVPFKIFIYLFYVYVCLFDGVPHVNLVPLEVRKGKWLTDPLSLELKMTVNHHVEAEN